MLDRAGLAALDGWLERFRPLPGDGSVLPGPAGRLDALDTELRRGRRTRAGETPDETPGEARDTG